MAQEQATAENIWRIIGCAYNGDCRGGTTIGTGKSGEVDSAKTSPRKIVRAWTTHRVEETFGPQGKPDCYQLNDSSRCPRRLYNFDLTL
ncbi:hypothetical protein K0M31_007773 [Melipona bicolor]|uniref:Uncharacterized protein n=1 Tax=Melipona bicolor TaxID=60889 RepID=A0AA40GCD0_9HYME|nr:hypothetical protein K0M31_007773 [Melipona bicolor]